MGCDSVMAFVFIGKDLSEKRAWSDQDSCERRGIKKPGTGPGKKPGFKSLLK
jgi:hypothetical protein